MDNHSSSNPNDNSHYNNLISLQQSADDYLGNPSNTNNNNNNSNIVIKVKQEESEELANSISLLTDDQSNDDDQEEALSFSNDANNSNNDTDDGDDPWRDISGLKALGECRLEWASSGLDQSWESTFDGELDQIGDLGSLLYFDDDNTVEVLMLYVFCTVYDNKV